MLSFIAMEEIHLEKVLYWRTLPEVTKYMFTDIDYDLDNQSKWFDKVKHSSNERYWIIRYKETDIGVISLNEINMKNQRTSAGYYIGEKEFKRLGGMVLPYLYNYIFYELGLNKATAEIMEGNDNVFKLHQIYGFREVGTFYQHIYKNDRYYNVHVLELLRKDWEVAGKRYRKLSGDFEVQTKS